MASHPLRGGGVGESMNEREMGKKRVVLTEKLGIQVEVRIVELGNWDRGGGDLVLCRR